MPALMNKLIWLAKFMTEHYFIREYGKNKVAMWSLFKDNKFVVDKLLESHTMVWWLRRNVIMASYTKLLILAFMK